MKIFSRITATVAGTVDDMVSKVENHDAVVESGIREIRKSAADSRVRLARIQKDGQRLRAQKETLQTAQADWLLRAKNVGQLDEPRALECLRRRQQCLDKVSELKRTLEEHRVLEEKLSINVRKIESRLEEISLQRNQMKSRQSVADASRVMSAIQGSGNLDDTFDRWESIITESEICSGDVLLDSPVDLFATEFEDQEQEDVLKQELKMILDSEGEKNEQ